MTAISTNLSRRVELIRLAVYNIAVSRRVELIRLAVYNIAVIRGESHWGDFLHNLAT